MYIHTHTYMYTFLTYSNNFCENTQQMSLAFAHPCIPEVRHAGSTTLLLGAFPVIFSAAGLQMWRYPSVSVRHAR